MATRKSSIEAFDNDIRLLSNEYVGAMANKWTFMNELS